MIFVICGPTASGKSQLAVRIARQFGGEIINGDAFQIYKGFDIGTAKPSLEERSKVPHHLFDFLDPTDFYSPYRYQKEGRRIIEEIEERKSLPIVVGGSGNYQKALFFDYEFEEYVDPDTTRFDGKTNEELYELLKEVDEESAKKIHPNNRKRVIRALSIYYLTGQKKSDIESKQDHCLLYDVIFVGIDLEREELYNRINKRVLEMIDEGLMEEAKTLYEKYGETIQAFQAIGYKEWIDFFKNKITREEVIENIQKHSRNYAKRQMTYYKNQLPVKWFSNVEEAYNYMVNLLKNRRRKVWKESKQ